MYDIMYGIFIHKTGPFMGDFVAKYSGTMEPLGNQINDLATGDSDFATMHL